mmetsp:Transcript_4931/g.14979  ORF Transcript_4931/g.14979 Transcript_4931/m.14979 type:complete len:152 (+) Transcript_4931:103-558(+)|eukprot:scaffold1732_cov34-Tisochrysis_lutea.AAC.2
MFLKLLIGALVVESASIAPVGEVDAVGATAVLQAATLHSVSQAVGTTTAASERASSQPSPSPRKATLSLGSSSLGKLFADGLKATQDEASHQPVHETESKGLANNETNAGQDKGTSTPKEQVPSAGDTLAGAILNAVSNEDTESLTRERRS